MLRFDRAAPGEGMLIYSRVENGKAFLEFQFFLKTPVGLAGYMAHIQVYDRTDRVVLDIVYPLQEEELAKGMLLHPHLWKGSSDPYVYLVRVNLLDKRKWDDGKRDATIDTLEKQLALRTLQWIPRKGYFLNGEAYTLRPVVYNISAQIAGEISRAEHMRREMQLIKEMGANTICFNQAQWDDDFMKLCDEMGFLAWYLTEPGQLASVSSLLSPGSLTPMDLFYYYKACWNREPFVYPVRKSLTRQENGNYSLKVYSNQKKVALYVEGILFEFQTGAPEFLFEEIPAGKYPLQLTAEAGECRVSLTVY